jgi:hypothetical protein
MRYFARLTLLAMLFAVPLCAMAQSGSAKPSTPPPAPVGPEHDDYLPIADRMYIKLSFTLSELDEHGKVINTRRFEGITFAHPQGHNNTTSISMKDRVPMLDKNGNATTYIDLNSKISYRQIYVIDENHVALSVEGDLSSLLPADNTEHPVIRNNDWSGNVLMPIGERKVLFSSDDLSSKHTLQLDLLVTRVR